MKNKNYKLNDLIRIWMKACFKRAIPVSDSALDRAKTKQQKKPAK